MSQIKKISKRVPYLIVIVLLFLSIPLSFLFGGVEKSIKKPFIIPLEGKIITSFRQQYCDKEKEVTRRHTGIDIAGRPGDYVKASGNGKVSYIGISPIGGRTVVIQHNKKIKTTYLNLDDIYVYENQRVIQGQAIATIGADNDPSSSHVHLHFAIVFGGKYMDPADILDIEYSSISRFIQLEFLHQDFFLTK